MFANGPGDRDSIPGRVIPKTQKMVLNAALLNTQHYKEGSRVKWSNPGNGVAPPLHLDVVVIEKGAFGYPRLKGDNFTFTYNVCKNISSKFLNKVVIN